MINTLFILYKWSGVAWVPIGNGPELVVEKAALQLLVEGYQPAMFPATYPAPISNPYPSVSEEDRLRAKKLLLKKPWNTVPNMPSPHRGLFEEGSA